MGELRALAVNVVHVVVPDGVDDPARPSGGNTYDRRICRGLAASGWSIHEYAVPGSWPHPDTTARAGLANVIAEVPDDAVVLLDGLIASTVPEVLVPEANRLRLVVLVHMSLGDPPERAVLGAASAVVATSDWTRNQLLERYALPADHVHVAEPGVDTAHVAPGTPTGGELLCVAAVTPNKGHDVLLAALAMVADLPWRCTCVGALNRDPDFIERLGHRTRADGIDDRVTFVGPRVGADLDAAYASADLLVLASRAETYGMVVTEALAHGLPVVATEVGGLPAALGRAADGSRPGLLVPAGDAVAFATGLRGWLGDTELRQRLRQAAAQRRGGLSGWPRTSARVSQVLSEVLNRAPGTRVCQIRD